MVSKMITRALFLALGCACAVALTPLSAAGDDNDCALYLSGPGRTSAYDYSLNLLKGNFGYEGQHTCITYDAVNQAYLEARNRIVVSQPKGEWKAEDFASVGELVLDISINLARRYGLTYEEIEKGLPLIDTSRTLIREACPPVFSHVECRAGKYRRLDGLCNNLQHPTWGATMAPFQRLIGPLFADGINAPRISHTGRDLPLSRVVSRTMHPDEGFHDHAGTVMVIAWGQFMDHDYTLTGTPLDPRNRNDPEECCNRPAHLKHPYCNEIRIPDDDYFYRLFGVKCIDFVRGFPSPRPGCRLGSRVPFNTLTGAIDGNTVYGVTDKFARKLRTGYGGLLRMNPVFKEYGLKDLLPLKLDIPDEGCTRPNKNMYCFEAGEIRVNEQLVLTVMHTLMAREHNRVAAALAHVNPHWDDETLFQEARRINIAEIQHITYNEFLPILLGKDVMEKFGLVLEKESYWDGYDTTVNPDVLASFAAAAYRFGHSLLPTAVERWSKAHKFIASKRLSDLIRRPYDLYRAGVLDEYVMGLMNQVAQAMDDSITQEVTNHLFKKVGARFGMDLVSFNMQRGREFGVPGYMEFRKFCGLSGADTFQDLFGAMSNETVRKYETIFEHPIDVDLWSGGVSERPLPGSMLGPTFACVIATQFSYSRRGDRFWFELPNQPSSFTPEQLAEIRKSRLARVICDNTDIIDTVQLYPMVLPDHELNPRVPCRSGIIPTIDFTKWAEPAPFHGGAKQFMTDAYIPPKNETNCEEYADKTHQNTTIVQKCGCNDTTNSNIQQNTDNTQLTNETTVENDCQESTTTTENNYDKAQTKISGTHNNDTVLKYVYRKDEKTNIPDKPTGHTKNSLRKKRSLNSDENLRYAASVPVIVNYKTSHFPPVKENIFARNKASLIRGSDLADFAIETLHAKPIINNDQIKVQPKTDYREIKLPPKQHQESEEEEIEHHTEREHSDERQDYRGIRKHNRPYLESESDKRDHRNHIRNKLHQEPESNDRETYHSSSRLPGNNNKPYQGNANNESDEYRDSEGNKEDESDEKDEYQDNEKNSKSSRENDSTDRENYQDDRQSNKTYRKQENTRSKEYDGDENNSKPHKITESDESEDYRDDRISNKPYIKHESTERDEYEDEKNSNERDYQDDRKSNKAYKKSESTEREDYDDNERNNKPYVRNESEDYEDDRKRNKPYRKDENIERDEYDHIGKNNKPYLRNDKDEREEYLDDRINKKPYIRNEATERQEHDDNRNDNNPYTRSDGVARDEHENDGKDSKPYRRNESTEQEEYDDEDRNKKPHKIVETNGRLAYRNDRGNKPYRQNKSNGRRDFSDTEKTNKPFRRNEREEYEDDDRNNKPYISEIKKNNKPFRINEREEYDDDERNSKPYRGKQNSERRDFADVEKNSKPFRRNEREDYDDDKRNNKPYRGKEINERANYETHGKNNRRNERKEYSENDKNYKPYQKNERFEKGEYDENKKNTKPYRKNEGIEKDEAFDESEKSGERINYRENENIRQDSNNKFKNNRRDYSRNYKSPYAALPKDINESSEIESKEPVYAKRANSKETKDKYYNRPTNKLSNRRPRDETLENNFRENIKEDDNASAEKVLPNVRNSKGAYYGKNNLPLLQPESSDESEEEEAIIAIMKRKHRKSPLNSHDDSKNGNINQSRVNSPIKIQDVDLGDFSYERIHVNDKGIVEPAKDAHENYDDESLVEIIPLITTTQKTATGNNEKYLRSTGNIDVPLHGQINEGTNRQVNINDGEVRPVVELNSDSSESIIGSSKEVLKTNANDEDASLETVLGVKIITDDDELSDKLVAKQSKKEKGDVKQQFERIPLNYNHNQQDEKKHKKETLPAEQTSEIDNDNPKHDVGTVDILTPQDHRFDENLNIKFDDLTIKLPEIKLPKDILSYAYQEPAYEKDIYNDEYSEEKPREQENRKDNGEDYYYDDSGYNGPYANYKKKDGEDTSNEKEQDDEYGDVDLYEKFVKERFGKKRPSQKRSEKLIDTRHAPENVKLFNTLQQILKKTENIQKEADKSGDPKAGYMWTLEYGQNL